MRVDRDIFHDGGDVDDALKSLHPEIIVAK